MENEFLYGNIKKVDLHGLSHDDALSVIIHEVSLADNFIDGIVFVHGYHGGRVLKDLVRKEFNSPRVEKKLFIDASQTVYKLKKE